MDESTQNVLQGLLDMSLAHTRDLAGLRAMNVIYEQVILQLLLKTEVLENLRPEAISAISKSLESANEMIEFANNREAFDSFVEIINQKIGR
jgi:hypothetical protein